jgi:hypothetical protein
MHRQLAHKRDGISIGTRRAWRDPASCQDPQPYDRAIRMAIRLRQRYGLKEGGIVASFPKKPHLMRWHTYLKAKQRDEELVQKIYGWTASNLPMLFRSTRKGI